MNKVLNHECKQALELLLHYLNVNEQTALGLLWGAANRFINLGVRGAVLVGVTASEVQSEHNAVSIEFVEAETIQNLGLNSTAGGRVMQEVYDYDPSCQVVLLMAVQTPDLDLFTVASAIVEIDEPLRQAV